MKSKKISHSAMDKYLTCPKMYQIHYEERLRPNGRSSALVFGSAMDEALNHLLLTGKIEEAVEVFRDNFKWEEMADVIWDSRDCEPSLVDSSQFNTETQWAWASLRVKGRLLLEEYFDKIYPLIEEVESVQKELYDRPGVIDCIVKLKGYGRVLLDNKTSARPYTEDSLASSTQLHLYAHDHGIDKIAFAVLIKQIQKNAKRICRKCKFNGSYVRHKTCPEIINGDRCRGTWDESFTPEAKVQLLVKEVCVDTKELITSTIGDVEKAISLEVFPRNLKACGKIYGKPCPYINYCWNNDKTGLEYKPETKE